ncbi:MAG: hypothetical protein FVQ77_00265 [Cytophagales bacterium]|nr:hypothetical protein [Cytophagales bacterium]
MKAFKFSVFVAAMSCVLTANAQPYQGDFLLNGGVNLYNTNNKKPFKNFGKSVGFGFDLNYFAADKFALSGGFEYFNSLSRSAAALGLRLYFSETFFLRSKGYYLVKAPLKGSSFDVSFGLGNDFMLNDHWAVEANADYYVLSNAFVFRLGMGVFFKKGN